MIKPIKLVVLAWGLLGWQQVWGLNCTEIFTDKPIPQRQNQWQEALEWLSDPSFDLSKWKDSLPQGLDVEEPLRTYSDIYNRKRPVLVHMNNEDLRWRIVSALRIYGFHAEFTHDVNEALQWLNQNRPGVIIMDGAPASSLVPSFFVKLQQQMPKSSAPRVLVVNPGGSEGSLIATLNQGADAYLNITWPSLREIVARVARLYPPSTSAPLKRIITDGRVVLNLTSQLLFVDGNIVGLKAHSFPLLALLMRNKNTWINPQEVTDLLNKDPNTIRRNAWTLKRMFARFGLGESITIGRNGEGNYSIRYVSGSSF